MLKCLVLQFMSNYVLLEMLTHTEAWPVNATPL